MTDIGFTLTNVVAGIGLLAILAADIFVLVVIIERILDWPMRYYLPIGMVTVVVAFVVLFLASTTWLIWLFPGA